MRRTQLVAVTDLEALKCQGVRVSFKYSLGFKISAAVGPYL